MKSSPRTSALRMLAGREHGRAELLAKLRQRFADEDEAELEQLIQGLVEAGYVDDARAAAAYARSRLIRGQGPLQTEELLRARGFDDETALAAIADEELDWRAAARRAWQKRSASAAKPPADPRAWLQSRGFRDEEIEAALAAALDE